MGTAKQDVQALLARLPDDVSVEDLQYHLYVLKKVERALTEVEENGAVSQAAAQARLRKWTGE